MSPVHAWSCGTTSELSLVCFAGLGLQHGALALRHPVSGGWGVRVRRSHQQRWEASCYFDQYELLWHVKQHFLSFLFGFFVGYSVTLVRKLMQVNWTWIEFLTSGCTLHASQASCLIFISMANFPAVCFSTLRPSPWAHPACSSCYWLDQSDVTLLSCTSQLLWDYSASPAGAYHY